jgi:hypothetical protein
MLAAVPAPLDAAKQPNIDPFKNLQPMRFALVRNAVPGCEPHCAEWISAEGDITPGTAAAFRKVLKQAGKRRLPLLISSGGGSVNDALAIAELIRQRQLDVAVARTDFEPCPTSQKGCKDGRARKGASRGRANSLGAYCASSCAFVLAGGERRLVSAWSGVGVHQIKGFQTLVRLQRTYRIEQRVDPQGRVTRTRKLVRERQVSKTTRESKVTDKSYRPIEKLFAAAGITEGLMTIVRATPYDTMHWLTPDEQRSTGLVTDQLAAEFLLAEQEVAQAGAPTALTQSRALAAVSSADTAATAMLRLGPWRQRLVDAALTLRHRPGAATVRLSLDLAEAGTALVTSDAVATIALAEGVEIAAVNPEPLNPFLPLQAEVPVEQFCGVEPLTALSILLDVKGGVGERTRARSVLHRSRLADVEVVEASACPRRG